MSVELVTSKLLLDVPNIRHGLTTRHGGTSLRPYASLNIGLHVGDTPSRVIENRRRASEQLGFTLDQWISGEQVHGCRVVTMTKSDRGRGALDHQTAIRNVDGLMTDASGLLLAAFFADCIPLFVVDPQGPRIALGHAGWRGTMANIAGQLVQGMVHTFGSKADSLLVWIGPGIGACCFTVSDDLATRFRTEFGGDYITEVKEVPHIDLPQINRHLFVQSGVLDHHIEVDTHCTMCNTDRFFSHRAQGPKTGRMAGLIGIHGE